MSIRAWYDVFCDAPGCPQWTNGGATRREARTSALAAGWSVSDKPVGRQFVWCCPGHAEYAHLDTRDVLADLALIEGRA